MVADRVHESAEALRLAQTAVLAQSRKDAGKGLLAYILYRMRRPQARTQLELKQFRKIADKMLLCLPVTGTQTANITCVEAMELQREPRQDGRIYV